MSYVSEQPIYRNPSDQILDEFVIENSAATEYFQKSQICQCSEEDPNKCQVLLDNKRFVRKLGRCWSEKKKIAIDDSQNSRTVPVTRSTHQFKKQPEKENHSCTSDYSSRHGSISDEQMNGLENDLIESQRNPERMQDNHQPETSRALKTTSNTSIRSTDNWNSAAQSEDKIVGDALQFLCMEGQKKDFFHIKIKDVMDFKDAEKAIGVHALNNVVKYLLEDTNAKTTAVFDCIKTAVLTTNIIDYHKGLKNSYLHKFGVSEADIRKGLNSNHFKNTIENLTLEDHMIFLHYCPNPDESDPVGLGHFVLTVVDFNKKMVFFYDHYDWKKFSKQGKYAKMCQQMTQSLPKKMEDLIKILADLAKLQKIKIKGQTVDSTFFEPSKWDFINYQEQVVKQCHTRSNIEVQGGSELSCGIFVVARIAEIYKFGNFISPISKETITDCRRKYGDVLLNEIGVKN